MALTSPGVQVSVVDESFYTPAEPGTVPMIFVATAENKTNGAGTGIASGTLAANAGKPYLLTSQRDLTETFGDPIFYTDNNNNPIHAGELNEYGLQAAYSLLGVSNRAWVVRADVDLGALQATADAPAGDPADGAYWFDTATTAFGIFEWNSATALNGGQSFSVQTPIVITDSNQTTGSPAAPKGSVGAIGDYAVVASDSSNRMYYKTEGNGSTIAAGAWVEVGSADWSASIPTALGTANGTSTAGGDFTINGVSVSLTLGDDVDAAVTAIDNNVTNVRAKNVDDALALYSLNGASITVSGAGAAGFGFGATAYAAPALSIAPHTSVPQWKGAPGENALSGQAAKPTGSVWIKTTEPNAGARWRVKTWNADTELWDLVEAPIYASNQAALAALDAAGGGINLAVGDLYIRSNVEEESPAVATFKIFAKRNAGATIINTTVPENGLSATGGNGGGANYGITIAETVVGSATLNTATVTAVGTGDGDVDGEYLAGQINAAGLNNIVASYNATTGVLTISHTKGGDFRIADTDGALENLGFYNSNSGTYVTNLYAKPTGDSTYTVVASNWVALNSATFASADAPTTTTADGTLWYSSVVDEVDIMIHQDGLWRGLQNAYAGAEVQVSATEPTVQSDGTALVDGDVWVSTADLENYPTIYKYNSGLAVGQRWVLVDKSDQTTEDGILFADARWSDAGTKQDAASIAELALSDYVDPDAPDPALYPQGMMLWNLRRSGFNVKRYVRNYIDKTADNGRFKPDSDGVTNIYSGSGENMNQYFADRWVTESANQEDGSGSFGRHAQRKVVVQQLQAMVNSNDDIRDDESRVFNMMATPGYPELIGEMVSLNYDRGLSAFIVGDSPARLPSNATALNEWGQNVALAVEDNDDGLVSRDEYLGIFYPWGFTSDNAGNNVVVPPSHMMLRTIALSDQVSYPWFAPAGTRRGGITNATATGYIDAGGEFVSIALNEGQRDTLYAVNVNPITFINGAGLVAYGQKTRARGSSSLDRINVARLVIYLRSQLNKLAKPYIFEPNDKITRDQIKQAAESLMLELVGARALYDFLVVCDESNNTPARIDRNELYLDIAIEPVKAVEFVYIPLRLKNTGEIAGL
jgi:hypothetical protein